MIVKFYTAAGENSALHDGQRFRGDSRDRSRRHHCPLQPRKRIEVWVDPPLLAIIERALYLGEQRGELLSACGLARDPPAIDFGLQSGDFRWRRSSIDAAQAIADPETLTTVIGDFV